MINTKCVIPLVFKEILCDLCAFVVNSFLFILGCKLNELECSAAGETLCLEDLHDDKCQIVLGFRCLQEFFNPAENGLHDLIGAGL